MKSFTEYCPETISEFFENDLGLIFAKSKILGPWETVVRLDASDSADAFELEVAQKKNNLKKSGFKYFSVILTNKNKAEEIISREGL